MTKVALAQQFRPRLDLLTPSAYNLWLTQLIHHWLWLAIALWSPAYKPMHVM